MTVKLLSVFWGPHIYTVSGSSKLQGNGISLAADPADYIEELLDNDSLPLCDEVDIFITPTDNDVQTDEDSGPEDSDGNISNLTSRQLADQTEIQVRSLGNIISTSCEELKDKMKRT
ncbi:hypothetical protein FQA39_LY04931 [Lamprigera yunnana]|nr:hypothetical protein FQA39_LY04931 [Lamprigera yunnana]